MDVPDADQDVLAQPTRARVFGLLVEAREPLRTDTVAARLSLHVNGVRRHLEQLVEAGLVERRKQRGGRGRPGDLWAVAPGASPHGERPTAYAELAVWLAEAMPNDPDSIRRAEEVGRRVGRRLRADSSSGPGGSAEETLRDAFAALGFRPRIETREEGGFVCSLDNCPYVESAAANPQAVCGLHRGMTEGLLERAGADVELIGFEARDPHRAGCVVTVR